MQTPEAFAARYEDIFEALEEGEITTIIHGMNRKGSFRSGFSRQLADRFPEAVEADAVDLELHGKHQKGGISIGIVGFSDGIPLRVINLYCIRNNRDENGSLLSLKQLETSLHLVNAVLSDGEDHIVGMPRIGAGIAGGNWDEVANLVDETLDADRLLYRPETELHEAVAKGEPARGTIARRMENGEKMRIDVTYTPALARY